MYQRIETETQDGVGRIWLNRPEKRNALDRVMVDELYRAVTAFGADQEVRAIVIGGRGRAFCAGADLAYLQQMQDFTVLENAEDSAALGRTLRAVYDVAKPVIARVHGPAIAGGCGLATVCDIVVAGASASFGYTEVRIGFIPAIVMAFLLRKVPQMQTRRLLLTGEIITAAEARACGLVTTVIESGGEPELDAYIAGLTSQICLASASAVALTKQMLSALDGMSMDAAIEYAARMNALARMTPDCREGIASFLK